MLVDVDGVETDRRRRAQQREHVGLIADVGAQRDDREPEGTARPVLVDRHEATFLPG
ncbi:MULTISPECIES: hypothetical protein [unclassified Bradyrhizobium]|uniref:hypothetical protein n=1 Tax=unclassified Bradyrhizobium TaxID=2631580 RepID=UPI001BA50422|nr:MULTISPECIES: hypothetical protein [unclassified Bradyrhizobium]MBR1228189.1 hypothetical protein [Bradyrhizobium sp. AUGA SZCCT0176]MBR1300638.1 hypothetical protein [Bradyrhizobium sp. AUGA SZCCT0042]